MPYFTTFFDCMFDRNTKKFEEAIISYSDDFKSLLREKWQSCSNDRSSYLALLQQASKKQLPIDIALSERSELPKLQEFKCIVKALDLLKNLGLLHDYLSLFRRSALATTYSVRNEFRRCVNRNSLLWQLYAKREIFIRYAANIKSFTSNDFFKSVIESHIIYPLDLKNASKLLQQEFSSLSEIIHPPYKDTNINNSLSINFLDINKALRTVILLNLPYLNVFITNLKSLREIMLNLDEDDNEKELYYWEILLIFCELVGEKQIETPEEITDCLAKAIESSHMPKEVIEKIIEDKGIADNVDRPIDSKALIKGLAKAITMGAGIVVLAVMAL